MCVSLCFTVFKTSSRIARYFVFVLIQYRNWALSKLVLDRTAPENEKEFGEDEFLRAYCYTLQNATWFNNSIMVIILLNAIVMSISWPGMSKDLEQYLDNLNMGFTCIFVAEMIIKHIGLGFQI